MLLHGLTVAFMNGSFSFRLPPGGQGELSAGTLESPEVVAISSKKSIFSRPSVRLFLAINQASATAVATRDLLRSERSTTHFPRRIPGCSIAW